MCPPSDDSEDKTTVLDGTQETLRRELQKAKEQDACLIIIRGTPQGHRFFVTNDEMIIGRDASADICLSDPSVSKKHAKLVRKGDQVEIIDTGSSNGTVVNGKKVEKGQGVQLSKEDMVKLGNSILKFLPRGELEILMYGNLESAAYTDPLTKIYNKRYLLEALEAEFKRAKALHVDFSVLFFDVDFFKKVNDNFGHDAGDYVLRELAKLVSTQFIRQKDIIARYGGEEFVMLLANTDASNAKAIAERVRVAIENHPFVYEGKRLPITTSIGIAELSSDVESADTLLKKADKALYESKNSGRNCVTVSS